MEKVKPALRLVGEDGNAFSILSRAQRAAQRAGWSQLEIQAFMDIATSGDYDKLLATCMDYFDVS